MNAPSSLPSDGLPASTPLFGAQYEVDSMLGRGGFGLTYLCAEPSLLRWVAIKELFPPGATRQGNTVVPPRGVSPDEWTKAKRAFVAEARRLSAFADPCVVRVYGVWEENGTAYMAMEALDGGSLTARLKAEGTMPPERVARLGLSLCRALSLLHGANMLHRDLKPENIFFAADGSPILIDFGNARSLVAQQTQTISLALTPGYAPPEAYASSATMTTASDIYSLGATLWECLCGSLPPDATDRTLGAPLPDMAELVPDCSPVLIECLEHALELKPKARYPSASAFAAQLDMALHAIEQRSLQPQPASENYAPAPPTTGGPQTIAPQTGVPATGIPQTGIPQTGIPQTGIPQTGIPQTGGPQTTGYPTVVPTAPCAFCGQPVSIDEAICPHCGRFKSGVVPGQHMRRFPRASPNVLPMMWVGSLCVFGFLFVGTLSRVGRTIRASGVTSGSSGSFDDTPATLRTQSTQFRRDIAGNGQVESIRPQFGSSSIDIVVSSQWQQLSHDDKLSAASNWATRWREMRAPLPAGFQITDSSGRVLGGRSSGALEPWVQ